MATIAQLEIRRLQAATVAGLDFPHATQALRIPRRVRSLRTRRWRTVRAYAVTGLTTAQAHPARLADWTPGGTGPLRRCASCVTPPSARTPARSAPAPRHGDG